MCVVLHKSTCTGVLGEKKRQLSVFVDAAHWCSYALSFHPSTPLSLFTPPKKTPSPKQNALLVTGFVAQLELSNSKNTVQERVVQGLYFDTHTLTNQRAR